CPRDHLHLHSFPTRRSSDLDADVRHIRTPCVSSRTGWHKPDRYTATLRKAGLLAGARHTGADLAGHPGAADAAVAHRVLVQVLRSEEHTSELQSRENLVCRL